MDSERRLVLYSYLTGAFSVTVGVYAADRSGPPESILLMVFAVGDAARGVGRTRGP